MASELNWNATVGDFNTATNWTVGAGPGSEIPGTLDNANIGNGGTSQWATGAKTVAEVRAGNGGAGGLEVNGGTFTSSGTVWVGRQSGAGTGTLTVAGVGTSFISSGSTLVGAGSLDVGTLGAGSTGVLNINTGAVYNHTAAGETFRIGDTQNLTGNSGNFKGTLNVNGGTLSLPSARLYVGQSSVSGAALGEVNLSNNGTINVNNDWVVIGRAGGTGALNISGGTFNKAGGNNFAVGDNGGTGTATQTAGSVVITGGQFFVGNGANSVGTYTLGGTGSISVNDWLAVGREGSNGTFNIQGGTVTKNGTADNNFVVGTGGGVHQGTLNISGGVVDLKAGDLWLAESGDSTTGNLNLSGGELRVNAVRVTKDKTSATAIGNLRLNGGTLTTGRIYGGDGVANLEFNGTLIQATASQNLFIDNLDSSDIKSGGAIFDSNGFNIAIPESQVLTGTGGLTKQGLGTLTLPNISSYSGATVVNSGKLITTARSVASGAITVANAAALGVTINDIDTQVKPAALTLGTASLDFNLGVNGNSYANAPLEMAGALTINAAASTIAINITGENFGLFQTPLIKYGSLAGSGGFPSFVIGNLPTGMTATLVNNTQAKTIDLKVTKLSLPSWTGENSDVWDIGTKNWKDDLTTFEASFSNGDSVYFKDFPKVTAVKLPGTVIPGAFVTFDNSSDDYTLSGAGKISGTTKLNKLGTATVTLETLNNDFTGVTRIEAGTLNVPVLNNGGVASPIGKSPAAPASLLLAGGTLGYTGTTATADRGFTVAADNGAIAVATAATNLSLTGSLAATAGGFVKKGPGSLTLTGSGALAAGNAVRVEAGTLAIHGTGTTPAQVITSAGDIWVGSTPDAPATLNIANSTVSTSSWLAIGRGNGSAGNISALNLTGSTLNIVNWSTGYANNLPGNLATQNITLENSTINNTAGSVISENGGSTSNITLTGASVLNLRELQMGLGGNTSVATLTIGGTSAVNLGTDAIHCYASIGRNGGTGTVTVRDSGSITNYDDFTLGEAPDSNGTGIINLQDNGVINIDTGLFGRGANNTGTINQSGGTFNSHDLKDFQIGVRGKATWNLSAGTVNSLGWTSIARYGGSTGTLNVSGGTYNQTRADRALIIGEEGTGTLLLDATGLVNTAGGFWVGLAASGVGNVIQSAGTTNVTTNVILGNAGSAQGTYTVSAGTLNVSTTAGSNLVVGNADAGKGTLNVSGSAVVKLDNNASIRLGSGNTSANNTVNQSGGTITSYSDAGTSAGGTGIVLLGSANSTGINTYNLNGGTLNVLRIGREGSTGVMNFNGGLLKASGDSAVFVDNLTVASVQAGGALIDTNSHNVTITSALENAGGGGGLVKSGGGTLTLSGQNTYLGTTAINSGTLALADNGQLKFYIAASGVSNRITGAGTAVLDGDFNFDLSAPGLTAGTTWTLIDPSVSKTYGATFSVVGFTGNAGVWTRLEGTRQWTFNQATGVLALSASSGNPYDSWIGTYFPGISDPNVIGGSRDPDGDGVSNALEFALGGAPDKGADGPKVYSLQADTSADSDSVNELVMTIAVRDGVTPAFPAGSPTSSATTSDGLTTYTIEGSTDLVTFTTSVTPVTAVTTNLPAAPSGYVYRSFSLNGSNGLSGKGFLRVHVTP